MSKKQRDFAVWREALLAWTRKDKVHMESLFHLIRTVRAYDAPEMEIPASDQLQIEELLS